MKKQSNTFFSPNVFILAAILFVGFFLRIYKLDSHMMFIGDFAWFYFDASKMIETGVIPLVGIATSQEWLHQGPFWTYLISIVLFFTKNPLGVGYLSVAIGMLTIFFTYILGKEMFSEKVGMIVSFLAATSPLVIIFSRMPYHTSPIPLFSVLFLLFSYKLVKKGWGYFPFVIFFAAILYNFELATVVVVPFTFISGYLVYKNHGFKNFQTTKTLVRTAVLAFIPMLPILLYDVKNEFLQTVKFAHWSIYLRAIKPIIERTNQPLALIENLGYYFENYKRLIFSNDSFIAFFLLLFLLGYLAFRLLKNVHISDSERTLWMFTIICFSLFLINKTQSDAYLPLLFMPVLLLISCAFVKVFNKRTTFLFVSILFIGIFNAVFLIKNNFLMEVPNGYGLTYEKRLAAVEKIKNLAKSKNISLQSGNKDMTNLTLPYRYLLENDGFKIDLESSEKFEIYELLDGVNVQYKSNTIQ